MTGKTHRAGGALAAVVGFHILRHKGLLLPNVNDGLQLIVMYPFAMWGCIASDLDHHWKSCPQKDLPSRLINIALHITKPAKKLFRETSKPYKVLDVFDAHHRSWQTHSDITLVFMFLLLHVVYNSAFGVVNTAIASLVLTGICLGIVSHFMLDLITPEGIWLTVLVLIQHLFRLNIRGKISLVPDNGFFAAGGKLERVVYKLLNIAIVLAVGLLFIEFY